MLPKYSDACVQLVKASEGFSPYPAPDPVGIGTVCWGHQIRPGEHYAGAQTEDTCEPILANDLAVAWGVVAEYVEVDLGQGQVDALTDFVFNEGRGAPGEKDGFVWLKNGNHSTMLNLINAGQLEQAANQFMCWTTAKGSVLPGLVMRRQKEQALFLSDFPDQTS